MKIKLFRDDVKVPTKSHASDCGLDLYLPDAITLKPLETICLDLQIGFLVPEGAAGIFVPRSSVARKGLVISPAICDPAYTSSTHLILTNASNNTYHFEKGDRVCSFVLLNIVNPIIEIVDEFPNVGENERGNAGLGSSGR